MAQKNTAIISLIVIVLLAVGGGAVYLATNNTEDGTSDQPQTTSEQLDDNQPMSNEDEDADYIDDTYSATGDYSTPGGTESIDVTVTLASGVIESIEADGSATGGNSAQYQQQFLSGYESEVVGRSIDEVNLSRVAGSSLTSDGFNRAIDIIKNDARA